MDVIRRSSSFNTERIEHLYMEDLVRDIHVKKIKLHYGDLGDSHQPDPASSATSSPTRSTTWAPCPT